MSLKYLSLRSFVRTTTHSTCLKCCTLTVDVTAEGLASVVPLLQGCIQQDCVKEYLGKAS